VSADLPAVEAQARRYLALFPAWLRPTRGEEAVGLVLDLLPPDARRLPLRSKLDLVRAGLHARRIGTPPVWVWSQVVFGERSPRPVPAAWLPWLSIAVRRRAFPALVGAGKALILFGPQTLLWVSIWGHWMAAAGLLLLIALDALAATFRGRRLREKVCAANGLGPDGRMRPPGEVATRWRTGSVRNQPMVRPLLLAAGASILAGLPMTLVWSHDHIDASSLRAMIAIAAIVTAWAALAGWRALRRAWSGAAGWPLAERQAVGLVSAEAMARLADGMALAVGVAIAWGSAWVAVGIGAPVAAVAPGAVLLLAGLILAGAQRRAGRTLGLWDAVPQWAPQVIVVARPDADLGGSGHGGVLA
jgi:hypothetical protein